MSWSVSGDPIVVDTSDSYFAIVDKITARIEDLCGNEDAPIERATSFAVAALSVADFVGDEPFGIGEYRVTINGHSNPGNELKPGTCGDYVCIQVAKVYPPKADA